MIAITGTFLDEITYDIPSNNWNRQAWAEDFRTMRAIGIDCQGFGGGKGGHL